MVTGDSDRSGNSPLAIKEADVIIVSASPASMDDEDNSPGFGAPTLLLSGDPRASAELARAAPAWGVLPSDASEAELLAAVHALAQGLIVGERSLLFPSEMPGLANSPLTDREQEVLTLLSRGLANKQIANELGISEHTVKFHISSIYAKLNVTNRTEALRAGLRGGWIAL